ncbi:light-harvesting complex-like protein 3 isotype 1, chloroplastic [Euphorbia lathyris]|uniref:light-harvesting complex-like protein 3 isotype 1, chloroplastic n=1 Tax=Euphorbia lathyris TaxID=212925 RepID=UPI0033142E98
MASISISASSLQRAYSYCKKQEAQPKRRRSRVGSKQVTRVATLNVDGPTDEQHVSPILTERFIDERWKKGTWDLNMFVKAGKINWDSLIEAEAKRRKFLELYPEACTNEEPVLFRSSIIPWWAWMKKSYLPQAELLNGRAAMVGFFMSYCVDALTGLDMVGQTGNFVCKVGLFATVIGIVVFRRKEDFMNLKNLADEATSYDKQWQSSWEHHNPNSTSTSVSSDKTGD